MKTIRGLSVIVMILAACAAGVAFAQAGAAGRFYASNTQLAAKGTVENVENVTNGKGWYGVHLTLKSQDQTYDVRLGPSDFIARNNFAFAAGDQVEVWGSQMGSNNSNVVVARVIEKNGQTLTLRDSDGFPVWAGMGMGGGYGRGYGCSGCGCRHHGCGCGCGGGCGRY